MCGIFGYIGPQEAVKTVMTGLKKLDYRGYDSAGIAMITDERLRCEKQVGNVANLAQALSRKQWHARVALAHTRWATHGKPTQANAHPHFDSDEELAVVHNGIIENHDEMRRMLQKTGMIFHSETDSEVISQLIGHLYRTEFKGDFLKSVQRAVVLLRGAFAFAVIHQNHGGEIICAARECPLAIGLGDGEMFVSSDAGAFLKHTNRAVYLRSSEVALLRPSGIEVYDATNTPITKTTEVIKIDCDDNALELSKGSFDHYMLKEIHEQPQTTLYALLSRYSEEFGTAVIDGLNISDEELLKVARIVIIACGTSYHAAMVAAYMLEEMARIPVQVEISSEFRYKNPIVQDNTLAIAISQSGETADTIAAMRELKEKGAKIIGICNVQGSTIAREVDSPLFLRAGPEIGVASTKAFVGQLTLLSLLTLRFARMRTMSQKEGKDFLKALLRIPEQIKNILAQAEHIEKIAKKYSFYENFFYLGRRFMYPAALEGALKLKEIAYVNANGYPAGEMKHGPIALINEECPTIALCADSVTYSKMLNNLMEIKARSGRVLAIAEIGSLGLDPIADDIIWVPKTHDALAPILTTVATQLFAYYFAKKRGTEIDQPRNLAKSVTVE
jgi:glucosamine--fructose-6-phosphate aminotransferase (isomerizing)